jgi:hypothetical protein
VIGDFAHVFSVPPGNALRAALRGRVFARSMRACCSQVPRQLDEEGSLERNYHNAIHPLRPSHTGKQCCEAVTGLHKGTKRRLRLRIGVTFVVD